MIGEGQGRRGRRHGEAGSRMMVTVADFVRAVVKIETTLSVALSDTTIRGEQVKHPSRGNATATSHGALWGG